MAPSGKVGRPVLAAAAACPGAHLATERERRIKSIGARSLAPQTHREVLLSMSVGFLVVFGRGWEETTSSNCAKAEGFVSKIDSQWICCCRSERQVHFVDAVAAVARIAALPLLTRFSVRQCVLRCAHDHIVPPLKEGLCAQNRR